MTIRDLQRLFPSVSRRTLHRDLNGMETKAIVVKSGETNQLNYTLRRDL
jgi:DNA-binding HxlR family transcriptional regulator